MKLLRKYEEKKIAKSKKYLFSTYNIGSLLGKIFGLGECE